MKLVAGAKLRRATEAATAAKPYQQTLSRVLTRVVANAGEVEHPLLNVPDNKDTIVVAVLSSDRGLCGAFNSNVLRAAQADIDALIADGKDVRIFAYGKKSVGHFRKRGYNVEEATIEVDPADYSAEADKLADKLMADMAANGFEKAYIAYNDYRGVMTQVPTFAQVLPDGPRARGWRGCRRRLHLRARRERDPGSLASDGAATQLFQAFLETQAGEQAARMAAMDNATRNASDLIDSLTLVYNRARQAAITTELTEIVSGAEAL